MQNKTEYIKYGVICPICSEKGTLRAKYIRRYSTSNWCGPYYVVNHHYHTYSKEKYAKLREKFSPEESTNKHKMNFHHIRDCYLGKEFSLNV